MHMTTSHISRCVLLLGIRAQATPKVPLSQEELEALTKRTQDGGTEVVQAKAGKVGPAMRNAESFHAYTVRVVVGDFALEHISLKAVLGTQGRSAASMSTPKGKIKSLEGPKGLIEGWGKTKCPRTLVESLLVGLAWMLGYYCDLLLVISAYYYELLQQHDCCMLLYCDSVKRPWLLAGLCHSVYGVRSCAVC